MFQVPLSAVTKGAIINLDSLLFSITQKAQVEAVVPSSAVVAYLSRKKFK